MFAHLEGHFNFDETITEGERVVLRKAMSREPGDRHPSCTAFVQDLAGSMGRSFMRKGVSPTKTSVRVLSDPSTGGGSGTMPTAKLTRSIGAAGLMQTTDLGRTQPEQRVKTQPNIRVGKPGGSKKLALAGGATLGLLAIIGGVLWVMFAGPGGGEEPLPPNAAVTPKNETPKDPKTNNPDTPPVTPIPVDPPKENPIRVPAGTRAEPGAPTVTLAGDVRVPQWVVADRGGEPVRFRLITPIANLPGDPRPFYISESKVWNKLYRKPGENRAEPGGADAPAVGMTANEAAAFATTFDGGRLPTPGEWDHAAGLYDRKGNDGPVMKGGDARVRLPIPAATHGTYAEKARNQFGLIDMAGNGREWTAAVLPSRGQQFRPVPGAAFSPNDLVVLRGRNYTLSSPLTYDVMKYEEKEPQTQFANVASPYTGFRIVLPAPER
jgi:hypothetical protein